MGYGEVVAHAPQLRLRDAVRRFWPDARPYRRWLPVLLVLIALGALIETAEIWAFKLVVDDVLVPGDARRAGLDRALLPRPDPDRRPGLLRRRLSRHLGRRALPAQPAAAGARPRPAPLA